MVNMRRWMRGGAVLAIVAGLMPVGLAHAQDTTDTRLRKVEAEVKALQRQVFPGGDPALFPGAVPASATAANGTPATTAMTDVLTRMDAIEAQNARLTAQVEELANRLRQLEAKAAPAPAPVAATPVPAPEPVKLVPETRPAVATPKPVAITPTKPAATTPAKPAAAPPAGRVAAVKAIIKPQTADTAEDEYTYGFKLWEAKFYPEAEQQLKLYLDKYPTHKSASRARNLLGRAYLDEGKPREAAPWFLQNYQANKKGERAADSLLYLADAMIQLKDTNRACIALGEFADGYPNEAGGRLRGAYSDIRAKVQCN
ncbi:tetratricopeptide repeat protein [Novosphingobium sp. UBA1939]|uniref:tetratricopeptide repeat protein n=1 Tax=Novosphingobium sp. UBA1939 TaxID=1946982 RepID=UPI0025D7EE74|nr:hypothetical protein [Novosphingobium sp. UBA1939]